MTSVKLWIRGDAGRMLHNIMSFNFVTLLHFWHAILVKIDRVQKRLQDPKMNFKEASNDIEALQMTLTQDRNTICKTALQKGRELCEKWGIEINRRIRRRRRNADELAADAGLSAEEEVMRVMKSAVDRLGQEMRERFACLTELNRRFGFLLDMTELLGDDRDEAEERSLRNKCKVIGNAYSTDFNGDELHTDICDCVMLLNTRGRRHTAPTTPLVAILCRFLR